MTEAEWLACTDPQKMLGFLRGKASERKLRLLVLACCRRVAPLLQGEECQRAMGAVERCAAGAIKPTTLRRYLRQLEVTRQRRVKPYSVQWFASLAVEHALSPSSAPSPGQCCYYVATALAVSAGHSYGGESWTAAKMVEDSVSCHLLRDLFGPLPFRPVIVDPAILSWNNSAVARLAQAAYEERQMPEGTLDYGRLAVLADALEEAGCADADILNHLRGPGPHVRGCWVVDLLLGKG